MMISIVSERLARLLNITVEQAEKIAPQLQNEVNAESVLTMIVAIAGVVFGLSLLLVAIMETYDEHFKIVVWVVRISMTVLVLTLACWKLFTPTLNLIEKLK